MIYYRLHHETRFDYHAPVRESIGEVRMRPRDERGQSVLQFDLNVRPRVRLGSYRDFLGNHVHHYNVPQTHITETIVAESLVRIEPGTDWPDQLDPGAWDRYRDVITLPETWDMLQPSHFAAPTDLLRELAAELDVTRRDDPLLTARHACSAVHQALAYKREQTTVDSPIDDAIEARGGVCQDFAHILIAMLRPLGIPTRYVSGYLATSDAVIDADTPSVSEQAATTSEPPSPFETTAQAGSVSREEAAARAAAADASHAWVEALLPMTDGPAWIGLDPTHNQVVADRHIRTAIGRDYADVPPTRGVYRGNAPADMHVVVKVETLTDLPTSFRQPFVTLGWVPPEPPQDLPDEPEPFEYYAQQMQQQQQR